MQALKLGLRHGRDVPSIWVLKAESSSCGGAAGGPPAARVSARCDLHGIKISSNRTWSGRRSLAFPRIGPRRTRPSARVVLGHGRGCRVNEPLSTLMLLQYPDVKGSLDDYYIHDVSLCVRGKLLETSRKSRVAVDEWFETVQ